MSIALTPVDSSNIKAIGHDKTTNSLHVQFKGGGRYIYQGVDADKHKALMDAESKGKHFNEHIVGKHKHLKLTEE